MIIYQLAFFGVNMSCLFKHWLISILAIIIAISNTIWFCSYPNTYKKELSLILYVVFWVLMGSSQRGWYQLDIYIYIYWSPGCSHLALNVAASIYTHASAQSIVSWCFNCSCGTTRDCLLELAPNVSSFQQFIWEYGRMFSPDRMQKICGSAGVTHLVGEDWKRSLAQGVGVWKFCIFKKTASTNQCLDANGVRRI